MADEMLSRKSFLKLLFDSGLNVGKIAACTEAEVLGIEQSFGIVLPMAYREFLLAMGHSAGSLFEGTDFSCSVLRRINVSARSLVAEEGGGYELPENSFVFYMHQGYEFGFFICDGTDDPPVYQFAEGLGASIEWSSFTHFFHNLIEYHTELRARG